MRDIKLVGFRSIDELEDTVPFVLREFKRTNNARYDYTDGAIYCRRTKTQIVIKRVYFRFPSDKQGLTDGD